MRTFTSVVLVLALGATGTAFADKPQKNQKAKGKNKGEHSQVVVVSRDHDRDAVRTYFTGQYGAGNCPPGLAKKNNGCLPPGQAKKRYQVGQPLPATVVYVDAPRELLVNLSPPPSNHKYVIVDGDVLKLAIGTLLVVDAINGLR